MATIFLRHYAPSPWNPQMLSGPCPALTLREWEVGVMLCSLPLEVKKALLAWLVAPTDPGWPQPDDVARSRLPFTDDELRQPARPLPTLLWDEVKAVRQTLDMPLDDLHGIARDLLLVAHGTRLRQLIGALGEPPALAEIVAMTRPRPPAPEPPEPEPAPFYRTRWGGRWEAFFSGSPSAVRASSQA